ncbi:MAG: ABC transporter ATP-binding protein [Clostridia bacterium]|nr:ABC transporter ATP-binding protein [Clostridia bacterium]
MTTILEAKNLCKVYPGPGGFELKNVGFSVPSGCITGFIGRNGAGKTTTFKVILGLSPRDAGEVSLFSKPMPEHEAECKQDIGVVFGGFSYHETKRLRAVTKAFKRFYKNWSEEKYRALLKKFALDENKRIKELSAGMKVKYALALALSHDAKLLMLDEPTSGLDPVSRDEIMDIFREFVDGGERSILFSTHITSDLDKCADYIIYIRDGAIAMQGDREQIIGGYRLIQGGRDDMSEALRAALIGIKETPFGFTGLIRESELYLAEGLATAKADIESIMLYTEKYERHES